MWKATGGRIRSRRMYNLGRDFIVRQRKSSGIFAIKNPARSCSATTFPVTQAVHFPLERTASARLAISLCSTARSSWPRRSEERRVGKECRCGWARDDVEEDVDLM